MGVCTGPPTTPTAPTTARPHAAQVLQHDPSFWTIYCACVLGIDAVWVARYAQIACCHPERDARRTAWVRTALLLPGFCAYGGATLVSLLEFGPETQFARMFPALEEWESAACRERRTEEDGPGRRWLL